MPNHNLAAGKQLAQVVEVSRSRLRMPAIAPKMPEAAVPHAEDPSPRVVAHFQHVWATAMHDMPFVNPALSVEAIGFQRQDGDWLGVVITPWFINLFLLPGGGALWHDLPTGEHTAVGLPVGELEFIGDNPGAEAAVSAYQYCPLLSPVQQVETQDAARAIALDALAAVLTPKVDPPAESGRAAIVDGPGAAAADAAPQAGVESPARRGFLRAFGGQRKA